MDSSDSISTMRLYGATIGIVSGAYSGYLSVTGASMSLAWFMLGLGAVVLIHGIVLLTPLADRLGGASGPLMLVYSVLMLLNQLRMATARGSTTRMGGMTGGMGGTSGGTAMMGTDAGMVAIAVLMLASGLIMTVRADMMDTSE